MNPLRPIVIVFMFAVIFAAFVASTDGALGSAATTRPIVQADDGTILLHARDVTIHGTTVRYEPQPNKNTIGYWTRKEDWVSWDFVVAHSGRFSVVALQGCGKSSGGSEVAFSVDDQTLKMTVQDTGGFQNFVSREIGILSLTAGAHTLRVKPITKPGLAVMDLRSVALKPVAKERTSK
jgi:hypothetical protein